MSLFEIFASRALGWGCVTGIAWLAEMAVTSAPSAPQVAENATNVTLVGSLAIAVVYLWRANQALHKEVKDNLREQNNQLNKDLSDAKEERAHLREAIEKAIQR